MLATPFLPAETQFKIVLEVMRRLFPNRCESKRGQSELDPASQASLPQRTPARLEERTQEWLVRKIVFRSEAVPPRRFRLRPSALCGERNPPPRCC